MQTEVLAVHKGTNDISRLINQTFPHKEFKLAVFIQYLSFHMFSNAVPPFLNGESI